MKRFDAAAARLRNGASVAALVVLAAACASPTHKAPVEQRQPGPRPVADSPAGVPAPAPMPPAPTPPPPLPGTENAGRPGYYTVKSGDTLIRIGLETGQNWRDIVRWNGIENPNLIEVGQVLRIVPPGVDPSAVAARGVAPPQVEARPLDAKPAAASASAVPASAASAPSPAAPTADDEPAWAWPASGTVIGGFVDGKLGVDEAAARLEAIKPALPRVTDIFQTYLRELRPTDLNGSAGLFRLKEEIGIRIEDTIAITETGHENLSRGVPRTVAEIEALMKKDGILQILKEKLF